MGKLKKFMVLVENQTLVANGTNVSGQVVVNLEEPMKMKNLSVTLEGQAYCRWSDGNGGPRYTREQLIKLKSFLFGNPPGSNGEEDISVHPEGRFSYPFLFTVPHDLPSSVETRLGHIWYCLEAKIKKPTWKSDHITPSKLVKIVKQIDTNNPIYLTQTGGSDAKEIGCCFPSGVLSINASLPRWAFCIGEKVHPNVEVVNESKTDMPFIKARIVKFEEIHGSHKIIKTNQTLISQIVGPGVPQGQVGTFAQHQFLEIPASEEVIPSISNCQILKVYYKVVVKVDVPCGFDLDISIPIVIGTIPFRGGICVQYPMDLNQSGNVPQIQGASNQFQASTSCKYHIQGISNSTRECLSWL